MSQAAGLFASQVPLEHYFSGADLAQANDYLHMYILYKQASNLGISIPSENIDIDTLQILHDFDSKVTQVREKMNNHRSKRKR